MNEETMITETTPESAPTAFHRRRFLATAGAVSAAAFLAACGSSGSNSKKKTTTTKAAGAGGDTTTTGGDTTGGSGDTTTSAAGGTGGVETDLKIGAFAASLEVLAVSAYTTGLKDATAGKLGKVPPAVGEFATTAMKQHQAQLDAWNAVLDGAGKPKVTDPPKELADQVKMMYDKVTDIAGLAKLALLLEEIASATYLKAIPALATEAPIRLASSIQIIDMQHQAILNFALGNYPVPDTFAKTDKAVSPP
ncbi:MAG: ferritin-like domain-containing protein [Acidimicrobiales bacterium]